MEQKLGLRIERNLTVQTYLSILPRDLKGLLYKYVYLKSGFQIEIIDDKSIGNIGRTYAREAILKLVMPNATLMIAVDINYIKGQAHNISEFIEDVLSYELTHILHLNTISYLTITRYKTELLYSVLDTNFGTLNDKITMQILLPLTADILDALLTISKMENI